MSLYNGNVVQLVLDMTKLNELQSGFLNAYIDETIEFALYEFIEANEVALKATYPFFNTESPARYLLSSSAYFNFDTSFDRITVDEAKQQMTVRIMSSVNYGTDDKLCELIEVFTDTLIPTQVLAYWIPEGGEGMYAIGLNKETNKCESVKVNYDAYHMDEFDDFTFDSPLGKPSFESDNGAVLGFYFGK